MIKKIFATLLALAILASSTGLAWNWAGSATSKVATPTTTTTVK